MHIKKIFFFLNILTFIGFIGVITFFDSNLFNFVASSYAIFYYVLIFISLALAGRVFQAEVLFLHLILFSYYGFRIFFLSVSEHFSFKVQYYDFMRYENLIQADFENAILFLIIAVLVIILFQIFLITKNKKLDTFNSPYSLKLENLLLYISLALIIFKGVYAFVAFDSLINKAWPDSTFKIIIQYFIEYTSFLVIFVMYTLFKNFFTRQNNFLPILILIVYVFALIPGGGKGILLGPLVFLFFIGLWFGISKISKKFLIILPLVIIFTGFMATGQHFILNYLSDRGGVSSSHVTQSLSLYKKLNYDSILYPISTLSKRFGGLDWIAMSQSTFYRDRIGSEVSLVKTLRRIADRFLPKSYKDQSLIPNGRIIAEGIRMEPKSTRENYGEYFTLLGYLGFYGFYAPLFLWPLLYIIYISRRLNNPYIKIGISLTIVMNYFMAGDAPSAIKFTLLSIIVFQFWVFFARFILSIQRWLNSQFSRHKISH